MKNSSYAFLALLGAVSAQEACVEGKRVTISPGYTVEYSCDKFRLGQTHNNILSNDECAALCRDADRSVCSYNAARKMCIVGDENGKEGVSPGAIYMAKVDEPEDPFAEDPFAEDPAAEDPAVKACEKARNDCLGRETTLAKDLTKCQADLATATSSPAPKPATCGVAKWGKNHYAVKAGMKIADCKKTCQADAKCLSYSANSGLSGNINCYLYDKVTSEVPHGTWPNFVQYDKNCA